MPLNGVFTSPPHNLRAFLESSWLAILAVDSTGVIVLANELLATMFGYGPGELVGQPLDLLVPSSVRSDHHANRLRFFANPKSRPMGTGPELHGQRKDGTLFPLEVSLNYVDAPAGESLGVAFVTDMTERAKVVAALREKDQRLRMALESTGIGTYEFDFRTGQRTWSDVAKQHFGLPADAEIDGATFDYGVHPDDRDRVHRMNEMAIRAEDEGLHDTEFRIIDARDGSERWVSSRRKIFVDAQGRPERLLGVRRDITAQKKMEETLRRREREVSAVLDHNPDLIMRLDRQSRFIYVNLKTAEVAGIPREHFIGKTSAELGLPQDLIDLWTSPTEKALQGQPSTIRFSYPSPDGVTDWEERFVPELGPDGAIESVLIIGRDFTEQNRMTREMEANRREIRALAASLMTTQEEERRRVSLELHDQVCQQLASLAFDIGVLAAEPPPLDREQRLREIQARVVKASEETRHIAYQMHPSVLDDLGLAASLRGLCREFSGLAGHIDLQLTEETARTPVPRAIASCLYRIAQESLQNIAKHASAKHVSVALAARKRSILLTIADDGTGFNYAEAKRRGGLGLIGMEERTRLVRGKLKIITSESGGTRIAVTVPFPGADA